MTAPGNCDSTGESTEAALESNLIILEFELERDPFNPLYPPAFSGSSSFRSGISSPSDPSASTSESSGRTLVSTDSGEMRSTPEGSTPSLVNSDPSLSASVTANSPPPSSQNSGQSYPRSSGYQGSGGSNENTSESADSGGENTDEEWLPSAEDILESTTSRSKPLLALERLRRSRRGVTDSPSPGSSYASTSDRGGPRPIRGGARNRRGGGAVGMMDVFAVMAQMNEQLGAAPDLDSFLQVIVGIIKDLTQFHRVLVYQFDEAWNGKVVAELVDWTMTHDLFKGLHFPAQDIPAQVGDVIGIIDV